jgi:hypothetical protein
VSPGEGQGHGQGASLAVLVDGKPMDEAEARTFWGRFSAHMEENKGDLAGFAKKEGFASVHPSMQGGRPVLVVSTSAPQGPYVSVERSGGSSSHQGSARGAGKDRAGGSKRAKRR